MNWLMREDFPTPADPSMTTLYPVGPGLLVLDSLEEAKDAVALVLAEPGYELPPAGTAATPPAVRCSVLHKVSDNVLLFNLEVWSEVFKF
jgi:hypothetical protein